MASARSAATSSAGSSELQPRDTPLDLSSNTLGRIEELQTGGIRAGGDMLPLAVSLSHPLPLRRHNIPLEASGQEKSWVHYRAPARPFETCTATTFTEAEPSLRHTALHLLRRSMCTACKHPSPLRDPAAMTQMPKEAEGNIDLKLLWWNGDLAAFAENTLKVELKPGACHQFGGEGLRGFGEPRSRSLAEGTWRVLPPQAPAETQTENKSGLAGRRLLGALQ